MIIPEWLLKEEQAPIENKIKKVYNPQTLKQITRQNIKMNDEELDKELAKRMINPYYFTDEILKTGFKIYLESHNSNHATSILIITPSSTEFWIEFR